MTPGLLTASVGALLTFLAAFLTWASVEVTSRIGSLVGGGTRSTSGLEGERLGKATLVLALAALALCVLLIQPSSRSWGWIALALLGGLIVVLALIDLASISNASDLRDRLAQVPGCSPAVQCTGNRTVGVGVYLTILGGLIVLVGALLHHGVDRSRLRRRPKPAAGPEAVAADRSVTAAPTKPETSESASSQSAISESASAESATAEPATAEATTAESATTVPTGSEPLAGEPDQGRSAGGEAAEGGTSPT